MSTAASELSSLIGSSSSRNVALLSQTLAEMARPPRKRTPSQWADESRVLPAGETEPGQWRSSRTPYMIPIVDAAVDPAYRGVIAVMGTQLGKTAGLFNIVGRKLDDDPSPVLWVGPTKSNVQNVIEPQFEKMIDGSPTLSTKRPPAKRRPRLLKMINGVSMRFAWAGSATELASQPAHTVVVDERDKMKPIPGEGDVMVLAEARTSNFPDRTIVATSSPTEGNVDTYTHPETGLEHWMLAEAEDLLSPIWKLWQLGTRHEFAWPCLHCGDYFVPRMKLLTGWESGDAPIVAKRKAIVACPRCGGTHPNTAKLELNARGRMLAPGQWALPDGTVHGPPPESDWASFWVSGLCSPWVSFGERAQAWLRAARSGDQETVRSVINTGFGELYRTKGEAPPWEDILEKSNGSPHELGEVPSWVGLVFLAVDVQKDRLVAVIRGWGYEYTSLLLHREELWGDTDQPGVWQRLDKLFDSEVAPGVGIDAACVDAGYRPERVYDWVAKHRNRNAYASLGRSSPNRLYSPQKIETTRGGKKLYHGMERWILDHGYFKGWVHDRLNYPETEPGGWLLPRAVGEDYCKQVVGEQRMKTAAGRVIWVKRGANDWLDAEAMQVFLAHIEGVRNILPPSDDDPDEGLAAVARSLNA